VKISEWKKNRWSSESFELFRSIGLEVVSDPSYPYKETSSPDLQAYDGKVLRVHCSRTFDDDLIHEASHHIVCISERPEELDEVNWGMYQTDDKMEWLTCDLEVGLRILWGWEWFGRAKHLSIPDWWENPRKLPLEQLKEYQEKRLGEFASEMLEKSRAYLHSMKGDSHAEH